MDHIRLLTQIRSLQASVLEAHESNKATRHLWRVHPGIVIMPEAPCAWCGTILRSNGIWLFSGPPRYGMFEGMIPLQPGKLQIVYPGMPNCTSSGGKGALCLGTYQTGMALLGGPANLNDCPMGHRGLLTWYETYWSHKPCRHSYHWWKRRDDELGTSYLYDLAHLYRHLTAEEKREKPR